MKEEQKKFNIYVFLSTFARSLIEVFIPVLLYKYGYTLKEVIIYFVIYNFIQLVIAYPITKIAIKLSNKIVAIIGFISFISVQIIVNNMSKSYVYIMILAIFYAFYRTGYWISRRYYNIKILPKEHVSVSYSIVSILNQLAVLFSGYIGAVFLDFDNTKIVTITAIVIYVISFIPLYLMNDGKNKDGKNKQKEVKLNICETLMKIGKRKIYLFGTYEILNVLKIMFSLYVYIYVKNTFKTVGFLNLVTNLSIMIFAYTFAKKIDKKNNYLCFVINAFVVTFILKANITSVWIILICFLEGMVIKAYEISINKEVYETSKKIESNNYNLAYEVIGKTTRAIILILCLLLSKNMKLMIYAILFFILIGALLEKDKEKNIKM